MSVALKEAKDLIDQAAKITVLTGAGISTDSGIPDFRGPNGIWTKNPEAEKASNIHYYMTDPEIRKRNWSLRASGELWPNVKPNEGHLALAHLEKRGLLHMLVTQNVDGLHQMAGNDPSRVVEIHGTVKEAMCLQCDWRDDIETVLERVRQGDEDPHCSCGGLLKSATVSFGQNLFPGDIEKMFEAALSCDLLLAIGTSLQVFPVAEMLPTAVNNEAKAVIINGEPTVMDHLAEIVVIGELSKVLPEMVSL
ncbi:MAG: Sir2 family NAD-dependent protein deacetylase [Actinomycetota bacterium]|nr:NAD-dependent deacetylase [Acidimicrobiaceae bacterium]MCH2620792.1 Sir2 family NAD-dependent protein deacetylase [Acidimicrobiales bacterium]MEC7898528.1 Sir2 family NAD-dependent protein deacetylase [Actinomycetota bacterium]|tara:strand:- start:545 stop:1297 length:753 start_codon:yes stop_codon:yes gene_type:complete